MVRSSSAFLVACFCWVMVTPLSAENPPAELTPAKIVNIPGPGDEWPLTLHDLRLLTSENKTGAGPSDPLPTGTIQHTGFRTSEGIVVLNRKLLAAPYRCRVENGQVWINEQSLPACYARGNDQTLIIEPTPQDFLKTLQEHLPKSALLLLQDGEPAWLIARGDEPYHGLLALLCGEQRDQASLEEVLKFLPDGFHRDGWRQLLETGIAGPKRPLQNLLARRDQLLKTNYSRIHANQTLYRVAYPLTTLGMLACVFSIGHLLLCRPEHSPRPREINAAPHLLKMVRTSLILIVIFSVLDLVWTLLAHRAGQMQELNPLGNGLIRDPVWLSVFKGTATLVALAALFAVRKYPRGQLAAWWACLIVTLITIRWVAFNSLFVS